MRVPEQRRRAVHVALVLALVAVVLWPATLPATVEEQRARLPPPATCQDPVEGVWMSHKFEAHQMLWYVFTLRIRRVGGEALAGDITSHAWEGDARQAEPPPCRYARYPHWTVAMTAAGRAAGGRIEFAGTSWRVEQEFCGPGSFSGTYNLDRFTGTIDPALQEFQSVNNDGGELVNDPTVFRRVRCLDPVSPPHPFVRPPAFQPPARRFACNRSRAR